MNEESGRGIVRLAWAQGLYFLVTGVWPLVSPGTFQWVTGPKFDVWLVKTVGLLIAAIAATLLLGAFRRRISLELKVLAAGSAAALAAVDLVYALSDRIPDIYLADAVVEIGLVALWGWLSLRERYAGRAQDAAGHR